MEQEKKAETIVTHVQVFPNDSNHAGTMFGGRIMQIMDSCAGIAADQFASSAHHCVTASVENVQFRLPVRIGDTLKYSARVVYTGRTSMAIRVVVRRFSKRQPAGDFCTSGHLVFVAMDVTNNPTSVPRLQVTSEEDKRAWEAGKAARERLLKIETFE